MGVLLGVGMDLGNGVIGINIPRFLPFGVPEKAELTFALIVLVLPQLPMTMGKAVMAYTDLSKEYFGDKASKVSNHNVCISMAPANFFSFCFGGMPLCHNCDLVAANP